MHWADGYRDLEFTKLICLRYDEGIITCMLYD